MRAGTRCRGHRGVLALDGRSHREDVERIGAGRMHLADQNGAHELVVALAEERAVGVERDIAG